ncbi:MAG TPA: response regulator, partial [Hyphomicrobiales bacterium]
EVVAGQYVLIAITDTGGGMSDDIIARVFEPFFTTKPTGSGTGLGLSQVYGFIKQSGGHVKIYSEAGLGTTVKLYLPRHMQKTAAETSVRLRKADGHDRGAGQVILVVEDDADVRKLTVEMLKELGYTTLAAEDGHAALRLMEENPEIILLLTDVVMPIMNGRELADEAVRRSPELKVLFTTGYTRNAIVHNGVLDEGVHLIIKPFTLDGLAAKLKAMMSG